MKYLFVCSAYSPQIEDYFQKGCRGVRLQYASNTFQTSFINGLYENNVDFEVLGIPGLPCFPIHYKYPYTPSEPFLYKDKRLGVSMPFCLLMGIKDISVRIRFTLYVKKWIRKHGLKKDDEFSIITYQPSSKINAPLAKLKGQYPKMIIATIVADYYDYSATMRYAKENYGFLKRIQSVIECKSILKLYPSIDKYILLTKAMEEGIQSAAGRSIVIEGLADSSWISDEIKPKNTEIRTIAYTGQLGPNSCIQTLVDAFLITNNPNFRLVITGLGEYTNYILSKCKIDSRIQYKGIVSKNEMLEIQREATLLINPRTPSTAMTRFSFPSKIMEYMAAGTPVLTYKLDGIPEEYYSVCYYIEEEGVEILAERICEILSKPQSQLDSMAFRALSLLKREKTSKVQVEKIINFISHK